jgi:MSHA biogenesis protein MshQ
MNASCLRPLLFALASLPLAAEAAVCTSVSAGDWNVAARWDCGHVPLAADTVVIAHNAIRMRGNYTVAGLTINAGAVLNDDGRNLTVNGNVIINGQLGINQGGTLRMRTAGATLSGTGSVKDLTLEIDAANIILAAGSTLDFDPNAEIDVAANMAGSLTLNGTVTAATQTAGDRVIRVSSGGALTIGTTGIINAPNSRIDVRTNASLLNNGSITVRELRGRTGTPAPAVTQGANASLTVSSALCTAANPCTFDASASGNTVTYIAPATPATPIGNTYYNLAGSGVTCPHGFTVLGSDPCPTGSGSVTASPTSCSTVAGPGTVAWSNPGNALTSNNAYATAILAGGASTQYLNCTGFDFSTIPLGATITGITVHVERRASFNNRIRDAFAYLIKGGIISTAYNGATATSWTTADVTEAHGGTGNLWGTTWTQADIAAANFGVAFAATNYSAFATNRTASVDHISVKVDYQSSPFHHIRIEHDGAASTCAAEPVTLRACADAACSSYYTATDVTGINLSPTTGVYTWSPASTVSILAADGGSSTGITLARNSAGTATLAVTGTPSPAPSSTFECYNTATLTSGDCSLVYSSSAISFSIPNHTAGTRQLVTLTSCSSSFSNKTRTLKFWSTYTNPASGTLQGTVTAGTGNADCTTGYSALSTSSATPTLLNLSFNNGASPQATFSLCYPDVGDVRIDARYDGSAATGDAGVVILGNDSFIAKPDRFELSSIRRTSDNLANPATTPTPANPENETKFVTAGVSSTASSQFTATVTAKNAQGVTTPNYGLESTPEGVALTAVLVAPAGGNTGTLTCKASSSNCVVTGGAANFSGGATTLTDLAWSEVGILQIMAKIRDGSYIGTGEVTTPTASVNIGRFYPHHFGVVPGDIDNRADWCDQGVLVADGVTPCTSPAWTYMDEKFNVNFALNAENSANATTLNYTGAFAKLNPLASNNTLLFGAVDGAAPTALTARLDTSLVMLDGSGSFSNGGASISVPLSLTRDAAPDGPYTALDIGIAPVDSDGVTTVKDLDINNDAVADRTQANAASTGMRYGRIAFANAYGPELLPLSLPVTLQYWDGSRYVTASDDDITTLGSANIVYSNWTQNLAAGETTASPASIVFTNGVASLKLSAPGAGNQGSVDISSNAPAFLTGGTGRATFGIYRGNDVFIYLREQH